MNQPTVLRQFYTFTQQAMPTIVALLAGRALPACGPEVQTTSHESTGTSSTDIATSDSQLPTSGAGGEQVSCLCIPDDDPSVDIKPSDTICLQEICPMAVASCEGSCSNSAIVWESPDALSCALVALRDQTPGLLQWTMEEGVGYSERGYVLIGSEGLSIRRLWFIVNGALTVSDAVLGNLGEQDCTQEDDPWLRFMCLRAPKWEPQISCDQGWVRPCTEIGCKF